MADVPADPVAVAHALAQQLPELQASRVLPLGSGLDNTAFEIDGDLVVRFRRDADAVMRADRVRREARLLAVVKEVSPLPIPEVRFVLADLGCLACTKLPGKPLLDLLPGLATGSATAVASALGRFVAALHSTPPSLIQEMVETDAPGPTECRDEARQTYENVVGEIPAKHRPEIESFLQATPPAAPAHLAFSHNDLGAEHVLVDAVTGAITGVIDWSDATISDPAYDFGLILRDLGQGALDSAFEAYRSAGLDASALRPRAVFYARCALLEDLADGLETGQERYTRNTRAAISRLFSRTP